MSTHTLVQSGFTNASAVTAMCDALGLSWRPVAMHAKGWLPLAFDHAFEVIVNGERLYVWQRSRGQPFVFQSEGVLFRNSSKIQDMANLSASEMRRRQDEQRMAQERADTQAQEEARQKARAAEQSARERQQVERLAQQRAEEVRKVQKAAAETEAEAILSRMSAEASAQPQARPAESNAVELRMSAEEIQAMSQQGSASTEPAVGKMLQTNARALIQEHQEAVRSEFGLSLEAEELDGDVIVLTFRG